MSLGIIASTRRSGADTYVINGNFQTFSKTPYGAYTGMWGLTNPDAPGLVATSSMQVTRSAFPSATIFNWDVTPSPSWGGINGYLHISYGNYDSSPGAGTVTPLQVKDVGNMIVNANWTQTGDLSTALLCEMWLGAEAAPTGPFTKTHEIAFFPRFSTQARSWLDSLPLVGTGFTYNGVNYSVRIAGNPQGVPYIIAYRSDYGDIQGAMPYKTYFNYLVAQGQITGNEWVNGVAFGPEPNSGIGSLNISKFGVIMEPIFTGDVRNLIHGTYINASNPAAATYGERPELGPTGYPVWRMTRTAATPFDWGAIAFADLAGNAIPAGSKVTLTWWERSTATNPIFHQLANDPSSEIVNQTTISPTNKPNVWSKREWVIESTSRIWTPGTHRLRAALPDVLNYYYEWSDLKVKVESPIPVSNVVVNGGFDSSDSWHGAGWSGKTISDGKANFTASPAYDGFDQPVTLVEGKYYELTYTISNYASGTVYGSFTGGATNLGLSRSGNGTYTERLLAGTGNNRLNLMLNVAGTLSIDDVSLIGPYNTATVGGP